MVDRDPMRAGEHPAVRTSKMSKDCDVHVYVQCDPAQASGNGSGVTSDRSRPAVCGYSIGSYNKRDESTLRRTRSVGDDRADAATFDSHADRLPVRG